MTDTKELRALVEIVTGPDYVVNHDGLGDEAWKILDALPGLLDEVDRFPARLINARREGRAEAQADLAVLRERVCEYVHIKHPTTWGIWLGVRAGKTQQKIADELGITQPAVSKRQVDSDEWRLLEALSPDAATEPTQEDN